MEKERKFEILLEKNRESYLKYSDFKDFNRFQDLTSFLYEVIQSTHEEGDVEMLNFSDKINFKQYLPYRKFYGKKIYFITYQLFNPNNKKFILFEVEKKFHYKYSYMGYMSEDYLPETEDYYMEKSFMMEMVRGLIKIKWEDIKKKFKNWNYNIPNSYLNKTGDTIIIVTEEELEKAINESSEWTIKPPFPKELGKMVILKEDLETLSIKLNINFDNSILECIKNSKIINIKYHEDINEFSKDTLILEIETTKGILEFRATDTCCGRTELIDGLEDLNKMLNEEILHIDSYSNRYEVERWNVYTFYKISTFNHDATLRFYEGSNYSKYMKIAFIPNSKKI